MRDYYTAPSIMDMQIANLEEAGVQSITLANVNFKVATDVARPMFDLQAQASAS